MKREPEAMTQTRQVRAWSNMLTKFGFLSLSLECVGFRRQDNRGFAQSSLFNVDSHGVVGGP